MSEKEMRPWASPGDHGRSCMVNVGDLLVDHSYQRPAMHSKTIREIADGFDWAAFGALVVMERQNGRKYIIDGQQRWLAAKMRGDISRLPSIVFSSSGPEQEARAFAALNVHRFRVSAIYSFRAGAIAGEEPQISISRMLKTKGLRVAADHDSGAIGFPAKLITTWKIDPETCARALDTERDIVGPESQLHQSLHLGIFFLSKRGVNFLEHKDKLAAMGGRPALLRAIKTVSIERGGRSIKASALSESCVASITGASASSRSRSRRSWA